MLSYPAADRRQSFLSHFMQSHRETVLPALGSLTELVAAATAFASIDYESDTESESADEDTIILNDANDGAEDDDAVENETNLFGGMFAESLV